MCKGVTVVHACMLCMHAYICDHCQWSDQHPDNVVRDLDLDDDSKLILVTVCIYYDKYGTATSVPSVPRRLARESRGLGDIFI